MVKIAGDKALEAGAGDRLGFTEPAQVIASAIQRQPVDDGLVIGIEGRWGSGKSSLVNIVTDRLRREDNTPEIVAFKPWLIGDRNSLLLALFADLAIAVDAIETRSKKLPWWKRRKLKETGRKILKFAAKLDSVKSLEKTVLMGASNIAGTLLDSAKLMDGLLSASSLVKEKNEIRERIKNLTRRIVVIIDDVDRLEPAEVVEIMRLVRSVADFPNVIYVLCYDQAIVAHAIEAAAQVSDGQAYIEKIVQIAVPTPQPEAFGLRHWFRWEIGALMDAIDESSDERQRLTGVIDQEGGRYLATPRHVVKCLDSIRFLWPDLKGKIDLADLVWLHLVKVGNPKLYSWIEGYLREEAARLSGYAHITDEESRASFAAVGEALNAERRSFDEIYHRLKEFLPGIADGVDCLFDGKDARRIHAEMSDIAIADAKHGRRLASPDHYRLYFAFAQPAHALKETDAETMLAVLDASKSDAADLLMRWNDETNSSGRTKAEIMVSWFVEGKKLGKNSAFSAERAHTLLCVLADILDEMASAVRSFSDETEAWADGRRLMRLLLESMQVEAVERKKLLDEVFQGRALGWLTNILRRETFAHGRVAGHAPRGDEMLKANELDAVSASMIARYRSLSMKDWRALPQPLSALFAWYQAGGATTARACVARQIRTDAGLLDVLEIMRGESVSSSRGHFVILKKETLQYFMNYDEVRSRIARMAGNDQDVALQQRATLLDEHLEESAGW